MPPRGWGGGVGGTRGLQHAIIVEELLRRAKSVRENPSLEVDLTDAAVAVCDAMEKNGEPPSPELFFEALKERAMALRAANELDEAIEGLSRASAKASELPNREQLDAVIALCTALTYSEADKGQFDEAIALADQAADVLQRWGDRRRALMARQAKAYAFACMLQFGRALPVATSVAAELDEIGTPFDAAIAHHLVAHCCVGVGQFEEALQHAAVAKRVYEEVADSSAVARVSHVSARAVAGLGRFEEARPQFEESAEVVIAAGRHEVWVLDRLAYGAAGVQ